MRGPCGTAGKTNPCEAAFGFVQDRHAGLETWAVLMDTRFGVSEVFFVKPEGVEDLVL